MITEVSASASWHRLDPAAAAVLLESDPVRGLGHAEAVARRSRFGENALVERGGRSPWSLLWDQFASTLVVVLLVAAAVAAVVGSLKDAIAILAIVLLNAILGFVQEFRAERAMAALRRLSVPRVRVRRDGGVDEVASPELVPGDVVLLEAGSLVPADGRILEAASLRIQEAVLTGESEAVEKRSTALPGEGVLALGDQVNMAFMGTSVEPAERGVMKRPPQAPSDSILARGLGLEILWQGALLGAVNLAVAWWAWSTGQPQWQTIVLTTVVLLQVFEAQVGRSSRESVLRLDPLSNKGLLGATGLILGLQAAVVYLPPLHALFGTMPLSAYQMAIPLLAGLFVLAVVEASKVLARP